MPLTLPEVALYAFTILGGQGIVAWLIKELITNRMERDADKFRNRLQADTNAEIERLKNSLKILELEHQVRFSTLHERQGRAIAKMSALLQNAAWVTQGYLLKGANDTREEERAFNAIIRLYRYIETNKLYLPVHVCNLLDEFVGKLRKVVSYVSVYWTRSPEVPTPQMSKEKNEVFITSWNALDKEIPALNEALVKEFRQLLGVS
jgi:hypothetical protein